MFVCIWVLFLFFNSFFCLFCNFILFAFANCQILTCVVRSQCATFGCRLGHFLHSLRCSFAWVTVWSLFTMLFISSDTVFILYLYIVTPYISYDQWNFELLCCEYYFSFVFFAFMLYSSFASQALVLQEICLTLFWNNNNKKSLLKVKKNVAFEK